MRRVNELTLRQPRRTRAHAQWAFPEDAPRGKFVPGPNSRLGPGRRPTRAHSLTRPVMVLCRGSAAAFCGGRRLEVVEDSAHHATSTHSTGVLPATRSRRRRLPRPNAGGFPPSEIQPCVHQQQVFNCTNAKPRRLPCVSCI